ncbi:MAG: RnfABCDGE type electron transport complex subunit D [Deltaproteobacteria bacterium]|nr:RnfABCDGE type electron transport complex subunit D [Deltaproteobacteria bacterium]MBW2218820.1 RnfABCDGE type electron transport complex subunit D [Deltaproteobacteria bacterium]
MFNQKRLIVSHAPFWHDGSSVSQRSFNIIVAAMLAVIPGIFQYGIPAVAVVSFSIATAMIWELIINRMTKRPASIGDGNAAVIGLMFAMLIPATTPWWVVLAGTFVSVVIGKQIFGGLGGNPFNPALIGFAILRVSWGDFFDFNEALVAYDPNFSMVYPLSALKFFGADEAVKTFSACDMFIGREAGGIGATCGIGLVIGGVYLIFRGVIRWEIPLSFIGGVFFTALLFKFFGSPGEYAGPVFHLVTGYTLIGAFYLATEDSSSPVNFIPMLIYGAGAGVLTILIRNIGAYIDGVVFAILLMNIMNPLLDKIRPKASGKVK